MGGTAAFMSASLDLYGDVRGIIAESPFSLPQNYIKYQIERLLPFMPGGVIAAFLSFASTLLLGFGLRDYSAERVVHESEYPLFLIYGAEDPLFLAEGLQRVSPNHKEHPILSLPIAAASRGECWAMGSAKIEAALADFFEKSLLGFQDADTEAKRRDE